ncbi:hypothetical protein GIS00_15040 [Nakamurella sp. YIM 132087]|uniref:Chromosome partitioning protein n=1 Tax=Nakamurella alba TaxID=2665158 RepID=A0A7K1FMB9_9ACTN|nr:hypothetical protein [Nakamurella alba]MTD15256.1 hypothetical protein [Nakamurella alba]
MEHVQTKWAAVTRAAIDPALALHVDDFTAAVDDLRRPRPGPLRTVAVLGAGQGSGRSTVAALIGLAWSGWTRRRVVLLDAGGPAPAGSRSVGELLAGTGSPGRWDRLLAHPRGAPLPRAVLRTALTPDTAIPVLALPPGSAPVAPQQLEHTLQALPHRADLVVVDGPAGVGAPVLHGILRVADHLVLTARADDDAARSIEVLRDRIARTPGRDRPVGLSVVLVGGRASTARAFRAPVPTHHLRRSAALSGGRLDNLARRDLVTALRIASAAG